MASGETKTEAKRVLEFKKKKKKGPYGLGCSENRGKRQGLWPRVQ